MDIHSGRMILSLDDKTGGITKIVDGKTGLVHLDAQGDGRDDARLFRVIVPEGLSLTAGYIDSHEIASPKIDRTGKTVSLRWENIRVKDEATGVSIEVVAEAQEEAEELRFMMKLENHS